MTPAGKTPSNRTIIFYYSEKSLFSDFLITEKSIENEFGESTTKEIEGPDLLALESVGLAQIPIRTNQYIIKLKYFQEIVI